MLPENLIRHDLNVHSVGTHKVNSVKAQLLAICNGASVIARKISLGGQEASGATSTLMDQLGECNLLIDATANSQAFNLLSAIAVSKSIPLIWSEVYAGGIGGFVARVRPEFEPAPLIARLQYHAWCSEQGVPWSGNDVSYETAHDGSALLIADDGDISVISSHVARFAIDLLIQKETSFPYSAYVIGLKREWIFSQPYDVRPFNFVREKAWSDKADEERSKESLDYLVNLLENTNTCELK